MSVMSAPASRSTRRPWRAIRCATAPVLAVVLLSSACRQASSRDADAPRSAAMVSSPASPPPDLAIAGPAAQPARAVQAESGQRIGPSQPVDPVSYLAYAYTMALEVPGDRLAGVMDAHVAACRSAGLRLCQLVGSGRDGDPASALRGSLSLRAEPAWLQRFMQGVLRDAASADGRVTGQTTTTEDLTRAIVDTEATLRAKRGLRDRLQQLLATRPGDLADLLAVERELARVQGEIDSTESNLAAMRTRVAMSALTIEYASAPRAVAGSTFEPLRLALVGFLVAVVESTAALVTVVGGLLPWVLVLGLLVWSALRIRRRRASRPPAPAADTAPAQGEGNP
jgi:hypothetical protein